MHYLLQTGSSDYSDSKYVTYTCWFKFTTILVQCKHLRLQVIVFTIMPSVASFPGSILQVMESWAGPGNRTTSSQRDTSKSQCMEKTWN